MESPPTIVAQHAAGPPVRTDVVKPEPPAESRLKTQPRPASKKPDRPPKKADRRRAPQRPPVLLIKVQPVFFVPKGEPAPSPEQTKRLTDHLAWCKERYREMLRDFDTFTLVKDPLVHPSTTSLAELKVAPEMGVPRITGELLAAAKCDRFDCPYVFVVVVVNPGDSFPDVEGRPFNGGFNLGGGVAVFSTFTLDKLSNFQSTLQHQLGHAFGLLHPAVYGHDTATSDSIMSDNPLHHTRGMQPSASPGTLLAEDLRGLSLNRRIFPRLASGARALPAVAAVAEVFALGPMTIDRQPPYRLEVTTNSGEMWGTRASNAVQNRILPIEGRKFVPGSAWHSGHCPNDWASVVVTFPIPVTLGAVGIHARHPRHLLLGTDGVQVEIDSPNGFQPVLSSPLWLDDQLVEFNPTRAKVWRFSFHFEKDRDEVVLRGLQFFNRIGEEIFPPPVPYDGDSGFFRSGGPTR